MNFANQLLGKRKFRCMAARVIGAILSLDVSFALEERPPSSCMEKMKNCAVSAELPLHVPLVVARADSNQTTLRNCAEISRFTEPRYLPCKPGLAVDHSRTVAVEDGITASPNLGNVGIA